MAVSTVSSTLPLFDRSNTLLDSPVTSYTPSRQAASRRQLFPQLDSSEATPSENGSVYDAKHACSDSEASEPPRKRARSRRRSHSRSLSGEQWPLPDSQNGPGAGVVVRFINRPDATPLTTIIEQKSIATLRSARSLVAAVTGTAGTHASRSAAMTEQKQSSRSHTGRRQAALSIDEATLRDLHEIIENQRPPGQNISSGSGSDYVRDAEHLARPISPPHSPPARTQTPCGLPRWPGDLPTSFPPPRRRVLRVRSLGCVLRDFFRGPRGELGGRDPGNQTAMRGVHEVQQRRQSPHARQSNHRAGLAYWAPPCSGHGTSDSLDQHTRELDGTDTLGNPLAGEWQPGFPSQQRERKEERGQGSSTPRGPRQLEDRQGPVQASMPGSAPPNVAQAAPGQASRCPLTPPGCRQERLHADDPGRTDSPNSLYSTPTQTSRHSSHPLIPAPLFTSPPHSRRDLDPRVPVSPYDRLAHVLSTGKPTSRDKPSHSHRERDRDGITARCTTVDFPTYGSDAASLRSLDNERADVLRMVSIATGTPDSTFPSTAAASSNNRLYDSHYTSPTSSIFSTSPVAPLFLKLESQPQTNRPLSEVDLESPPSLSGITVIRSAALPILLPLAAAEGIVRSHPLPCPVTRPYSNAGTKSILDTQRAPSHLSGASPDASIRAIRGSSADARSRHSTSCESFYTAAQTPGALQACSSSALGSTAHTPLNLDQVLASASCGAPSMESQRKKRSSGSRDSMDEEKSIGEHLGWLLRVCFCQPVGGVEDLESGGDTARCHRRAQHGVR